MRSWRRVLIVSPNFPPINAPDHQRVRMSLPHLADFGWQADVLAIEAKSHGGLYDPALARSVPASARVIAAKAVPARLTRRLGFEGLAWRALAGLNQAGAAALERGRYDLVFFSTTVFPVIALGRLWRRRFNVPYSVDFQDPWQTDYYDAPGAPRPPGGRIKYAAAKLAARVLEPFAMHTAAGVISVSADYTDVLLKRYPGLEHRPHLVLPFAGSERDLELAMDPDNAQSIFERADGKAHWVYAGVAGDVMAFSLRSFFRALARARAADPGRYAQLVVHFVGTSYAGEGRGRKSVESFAREFGVADLIDERPARIPYFEALRCLLEADALIVPGTDDPAYTASKVYPYILAKKPLLAIFHERSGVVETVTSTSAGTVVTFSSSDSIEIVSQRIFDCWFARASFKAPVVNGEAFRRHTAREMTRRLCEHFDLVVSAKETF